MGFDINRAREVHFARMQKVLEEGLTNINMARTPAEADEARQRAQRQHQGNAQGLQRQDHLVDAEQREHHEADHERERGAEQHPDPDRRQRRRRSRPPRPVARVRRPRRSPG